MLPEKKSAEVSPAKKERAKRGTAMTFAGRRPPQKDAEKRRLFFELRETYYKLKQDEHFQRRKKTGAAFTENCYHRFMHSKMKQLAQEGVSGPERMLRAAAEWQEQQTEEAALLD